MSNELNAGRVVVGIDLDNDGLKEKADESKESLRDIAQSAKAVGDAGEDAGSRLWGGMANPQGVQEVTNWLNDIPNKTKQATQPVKIPVEINDEDILNSVRLSLEKIGIEGEKAESILKTCFSDTTEIRKYAEKIKELGDRIEQSRAAIKRLQSEAAPAVYKSPAQIGAASAALEKETQSLQKLSRQYDAAILAQDTFVKKQAQSAEKLADKKAYKDASTGVDLMTSSLRTLDNIAPGTVSSLSDVITQVQIAKRAFHQAATPALAWGTAIAAGVGIVANLIVTGLSQIQEKQEEARRQAAQLAEEYKKESETLQDLSDDYVELKTKIDTTSLSHDEESSTKKQLLQVQEKLVEMYGAEAGNLDLVNGNIDVQIEKIKELAVAKAKLKEQEIFAEAKKAREELATDSWYYTGSWKFVSGTAAAFKELDTLTKKYGITSYDEGFGTSRDYSLTINTADAEKTLREFFNDLDKLQEKFIDEGAPQEAIDNVKSILSSISKAINEATNDDIQHLKSIVEQSEQLRETIESNGANLFPEDKTAEYKIRSIQQYTTAVNDLGSAYATLHEGQQLDLDTILSLIDTYPQFAQAIASGTLSLSDQETVVKQLFEAKKAEALASIEADRQKVESLRDATQEIIDLLQTQLKAYKTMFGGGAFGDLYGPLITAQAELAGYNEQLDQLNARTKAYQSISINDYLPDKKAKKKDDRNEALQQELKLLEHRKALNQLSAQDEIAWLERINATYSKNADEQMDMEKRLYNARKALQEAEEQAAKDALNEALKGIENKKALNKITTEEEINQLQRIRQTYRMNAEDAMSLEIKLYNLKKTLRDERTDKLDNIADGVTEALKNKYEKQKEFETNRINQSIKSWQDWEDKTVSAIQGQIDALDELSKAQESEDKRQEYETKRQATALQLAYEKDDYNRKQLQKELNRLDQEEAKRLEAEAREKQKEELQKQMDKAKEESAKQQDALKQRQDALNEQYEKLTSSFALEAEAQKTIMEKGMNGVIDLIKSFAPEFNLAGKTLAEKLYEGFKSKNWDIDAYSNIIQNGTSSAYQQAQRVAIDAANKFWRTRTEYNRQTGMTTAPAKIPEVKLTVNFNQPVQSPVETQRALRKVSQELARQIMK